MLRQTFQNILPWVQKPSQYLGSEIHTVRKDPGKIKLRFALVFPDLYEIGMSYLGMQILYHILNSRDGVAAERFFAPGEDMERQLRTHGIPLLSLETKTPLSEFHIVGVSLLYELNYTNILTILDLGRIPFYAQERNESHPIVIAGGPCAFNPEPVADFFDAIVIGDGEEVIRKLTDIWMAWKKSGASREILLKRWSDIDGIYIPSFFETSTDTHGFQILKPRHSEYTVIKKSIVSDLDQAPFPDCPIIPFGKPIHDRLSLEVARGCTRGCRFCQAGMIYRPVRERSPDHLLALADKALSATGYEDISLLSLSTGDYGSILPLLTGLMMRCAPEKIAVSLPSLRVETLTSRLMEQVKKVRKTGFTVAVEAGSQRLRNVINKNNMESDLIAAIENAFRLGWHVVKLYFMIGLPTETEKDIEDIVSLVRRLQKIRHPRRGRGNLNVSVSTFIPKSHTPFQWSPQIPLTESASKLRWLKEQLKGRTLQFKWHNPKMSILEGLLARGDRRLSTLLVNAYRLGCRLDGWSDRLRYDLWEKAIALSDVDIDFYTTRKRFLDEPLPWDHIDCGVTKDFLKDEWRKALQQESTADCRTGACNLCGVCNHADIKPVTFHKDEIRQSEILQLKESPLPPFCQRGETIESSTLPEKRTIEGLPLAGEQTIEGPPFQKGDTGGFYTNKLRISYSKRGEAKYFGHLELVQIFRRAFRRTPIPLKYSEGFHPLPKISFETALPIGIESMKEHCVVTVGEKVDSKGLIAQLNRELPNGITIRDCVPYLLCSSDQARGPVSYTVQLKNACFAEFVLQRFLDRETWPIHKTSPKGKVKRIDLRIAVKSLKLIAPDTLMMTFNGQPSQTLRPSDVITNIFGLPENVIKEADIVKFKGDHCS